MSSKTQSTDDRNGLPDKGKLKSDFGSPLCVAVDTLLSMQLLTLIENARVLINDCTIVLHLFTRKSSSLGVSPFLTSKKVLRFEEQPEDGHVVTFNAGPTDAISFSNSHPPILSHLLEVETQQGKVGTLQMRYHENALPPAYQNLKWQIEQVLQRTITHEKIRKWYGHSSMFCGVCDTMLLAEHQLCEFSKKRTPILLKGEKNAGYKLAAFYCASAYATHKVPFVELCNNRDHLVSLIEWESALSASEGGILYIRDIGYLSKKALARLQQYCQYGDKKASIIIGTALGREGENALDIWFEYHCHVVTLPSLEERSADFRFICYQYFTQRYPSMASALSEKICTLLQCEKSCSSVKAIHKCIDSIESLPIEDDVSIERLRNKLKLSGAISDGGQCAAKVDQEEHSQLVIPLGSLYASRFSQSLEPSKEHPAVLKALTHLAEHYQHTISLQELAEHAYVSPSHLSYLLKKRFGKSFKGILIEFRIEKAREILRDFPVRQITQVCIDVGFLDLSHFEKTFKKMTGLTPRQYREEHKTNLSIFR